MTDNDGTGGTGAGLDRAAVQALIDAAERRIGTQLAALKAAIVNHATTAALTAAVDAIRQLPSGGSDGQLLGRASGSPAWVASSSVLPAGSDGQVLGHESGAPAWITLPSLPDTLVRVLDPWPEYPPDGIPAGQPFFKGFDEAAAPRGWYQPVDNPVQPLNRFQVAIGNGPLANQHGYLDASAIAALSTSFGGVGDPEAGRNVSSLSWRNTPGSETTELRLSKAWVGRSPESSLVVCFSRADTGVLVNSITVRRNAAADDADNWAYSGDGAPNFTSGLVIVDVPPTWQVRPARVWRMTNTPRDLVRSLEALTGAARLDRTALRGPHVVPPVTAAPAVAALRPGELVNVQASASAAPQLKIARAAYDTPVTNRNRVVLTTNGHGNYQRGDETGSASDNYQDFVGLVSWAADDAGSATLNVGLRLDMLGANPPGRVWIDGVKGRGAARTLFEQYGTGHHRTIDGVAYRRYVSNRFPVTQQVFQGLQTWTFHLSASGAGSPLNFKPATEHTAAALADVGGGAAPQFRTWTGSGTVRGPSYACSWLVLAWGAGGGGGAGGNRNYDGGSGGETRVTGTGLDLRASGGVGGQGAGERRGWHGAAAAGGSGGLIVAGGGAGGGQAGGDREDAGLGWVGQPGQPGGLAIALVRPTAGAAYRITIGNGGAGGVRPGQGDRGGAGGGGRVAILELR